ncbi:MAG TPA: AAA family ATPase [Saprospiraceae bacterium]|nr:AAA family ATPase [Saprospiraceae bacterium]
MNVQADLALQYIQNTNRHIFLTGKAGTGKTTLMKKVVSECPKSMAVIAPTGVAAINAGGVTIHSFFQLPPKNFIPNNDTAPNTSYVNQRELVATQKLRREQIKVIRKLELLIIDEISMVKADVLDIIDFTLRRLRKNKNLFGGVQLLLIGDLLQLPPIVKNNDSNYLRQYYATPYFFDSQAWKNINPINIELTKVYRQNDQGFINILNNLRNGIALDDDISKINKRYQPNLDFEDLIILTTHNYKADKINNQKLEELNTKSVNLPGVIEGNFSINALPIPENLVLKVGCQVMFVKNHREGLYYNGLLAKVTHIDKDEDLIEVKTLEDGKLIMVSKDEWTSTRYETDAEGNISQKEDGKFVQFPLKLAWAITVHKSQGLTFQKLALDLEDTFAPGQLYVALSRCRTLQGLQLKSKIDQRNVLADSSILNFYTRIQNQNGSLSFELENAKKEYQRVKLIDRFDFQSISEIVMEIEEYNPKQDIELRKITRKWNRQFDKKLKALEAIAVKFQLQLKGLLINDEDDPSMLKSRLVKAIDYFTKSLNDDLLEEINIYQKDISSNYKKNKKYNQLIESLQNEIYRHITKLYIITFNDSSVYTGEKIYARKEVFNPKNAKVTYKIKSTYEETLEYWNQGYSADKIAKTRKLTLGTIETHLNKLLQEDQVHIDDLIFPERLNKLKAYFDLKDENQTLTTIINKVPFETSFGELRWVQTWLRKNAS